MTIFADESMLRVQRLIERVAKSGLSVLFLGETGVGKEICAETLHRASPRAQGELVRLNCAALPAALLESELFGHERGAFTGADGVKPGLLETASGGTLFLDEIGELPRDTQAKLLRALESQEILRLGATRPRKVDFRLVTATNDDLRRSVAEGRFRSDLYFRINGITIAIPPLRARRGDIEPLAQAFLARVAQPAPRLSPAAREWLERHDWPGNVRELRNLIERAAVLCDGAVIEPHCFHAELAPPPPPRAAFDVGGIQRAARALEEKQIIDALQAVGGNQRAAARMLGLSRASLWRRLNKMSEVASG